MTYSNTQARQRRTREETARLGREIHQRNIRRQVEADHHGEIVAIDVDSGDWGTADSVISARERRQALRPNAVDVLFFAVNPDHINSHQMHNFSGVGNWPDLHAPKADEVP